MSQTKNNFHNHEIGQEYEIKEFGKEKRLINLLWNDKSYKYVDNGDKVEMQRHAFTVATLPPPRGNT